MSDKEELRSIRAELHKDLMLLRKAITVLSWCEPPKEIAAPIMGWLIQRVTELEKEEMEVEQATANLIRAEPWYMRALLEREPIEGGENGQ